jgi:hypothetical protein
MTMIRALRREVRRRCCWELSRRSTRCETRRSTSSLVRAATGACTGGKPPACRAARTAMHCWLSTGGRCMCRVDWWRPGDRRSCVPLQPAGDWGSGQQWPFRSMVPDAHVNGTIHLYYSGCLGPHGDMYSTLPAEVSHGGHVIFTPACLFCKLLKKCIQVIPGAHERGKLTLPPVANRLRCSPRPKSTTALAAPAPCTAKVEVEARTPGALKIYTPRTNPSSTS